MSASKITAGICTPLVGNEEVDDRMAADLLLAVAAEPNVDRQLAGSCQVARSGE